jgi:hypothetical protein
LKNLWPSKVEGVENKLKKPPNAIKANSWTPKEFLYVAMVL